MQYLSALLILAASCIIIPVIAILVIQWSHISSVPSDVPWVDLRNKRFLPKLRAQFRSIVVGRKAVEEGYEKYTKHGKPFILPGVHWTDVILPPSDTNWLISQPEHVMSIQKAQDTVMGLEYLVHGESLTDMHDFSVLRRDLTRQMGNVVPAFLDELDRSTNEQFGGDAGEEFREIWITKAMQYVLRRALTRIFVGLPFCRNESWLRDVHIYEQTFGFTGLLLFLVVPQFLKPLVAPIIALPFRIMQWAVIRSLIPEVRKRITAHQALPGPEKKTSMPSERRNDALQWVLETAAQRLGFAHVEPFQVATKTVLFDFFAIHTTTTMAIEILVELLCYPSATDLMEDLREEAKAIFPQLATNPQAVRQMQKIDSVIREVLRFDPMSGHGLMREVIAPEGVTTPEGQYLPRGTHVSSIVTLMQRDIEIHGDGWDEFQPLRYYNAADGQRQEMAVQVNDRFLSFGLGRHACPGRFFAVQSLKLVLGNLLLHYDFEPLAERPKMINLGDSTVPGEKMKVKVRRRQAPFAST